eukprot:7690502-Ditylum_brightwellii.AAC.1
MNLVHHHNLKAMMNHFASQEWRWPGAMMTAITKKCKKQTQRKQSIKNKQSTKPTYDIPMQPSPEVRGQHERFIPDK